MRVAADLPERRAAPPEGGAPPTGARYQVPAARRPGSAGLAEALAADHPAAVSLPGGGVIYLDRRLPFLLAYRRPPGRCDKAAEQLLTSEACYAVDECAGDETTRPQVQRALRGALGALAEYFPAVLLAEVWTTPPRDGDGTPHIEEEPSEAGQVAEILPGEAPPPAFRVVVPEADCERLDATAGALIAALRRIELDGRPARATRVAGEVRPPGLPPLLAADRPTPGPVVHLGIEVAPVFRAEDDGPLYPRRFSELRSRWHRALGQGLAVFCREQAGFEVADVLALGRRAMPQALWRIDRALAEVAESFDFLLQLTPINPIEAWHEFQASGCRRHPAFRYRPLTVDVDLFKRRLYDIPLERIEDPALTLLFRGKQEELDRQITMLLDRGTPRFFHGSMALFGEVDDELVAVARELLDRRPPASPAASAEQTESPIEPSGPATPGERIDAQGFAEIARRELAYYRRTLGDLPDLVEVRDDIHSGLMVSRGRLLIGSAFTTTPRRARALVHHEVGTHVVTYLNGHAQRFRQLYLGFAGYEPLQEGLAVLAEHLVGGLTAGRLRTLAARVVAARALIDGADFAETFRRLTADHGFTPESAFTIVLRIFRGGGFTKDAIYLRGIRGLLAYLAQGGELEPLYVGKIAAHHVPVVRELALRGVLTETPLTPRFLFETEPLARLERVRRGLAVADLID